MCKSSDFKPFKNYEIVFKDFEVENKISEFKRFMNYINRIKKIERDINCSRLVHEMDGFKFLSYEWNKFNWIGLQNDKVIFT